MIKFNGVLIEQDHFGDGTLKCNTPGLSPTGNGKYDKKEILWCYDSDSELFTIIALREYLRDHFPCSQVKLVMPYIPHARQDREVSGRLFTLKAFAKVINSLDFYEVEVLDPHSDVSRALIDRLVVSYNFFPLSQLVNEQKKNTAVMYPDAGAAKKYSTIEGVVNPIVGNKHRNDEGRIDGYSVSNFKEGTDVVVIRDDICSYGGTFVSAAKALKELGVKTIYLVVTHCENNILKGEVFNYIDRVFTTDSIFTASHPHIIITRSFRGE